MTLEHEFGFIENGRVFLKPFLSFESRELGEVKGTEEEAFKYFEDRFDTFSAKVTDIQTQIEESENKGSFLMKILHLKEQVGVFNGLGDYEKVFNGLVLVENQLNQLIEENRKRNLEVKRVLIEELRILAENQNWEEDREKVKDVQQRWIRVGRVTEEFENELEEQYKQYTNGFFEQLNDHISAKNEVYTIRKEKYEKVLSKAKELESGTISSKNIEAFKALQEEWRTIGKVPKTVLGTLHDEFKALGQSFFDNVKSQRSKQKQHAKANPEEVIAAKKALVEKAEALKGLPYNDLAKASKELKEAWKQAGNLPYKKIAEVQDTFYAACQYADELFFAFQKTTRFVKGLSNRPIEEQNKAIKQTLRKMIQKDQADIATYEENAGNFTFVGANTLNKVLDTSIESKKRKFAAKKAVIKDL